jgi:ubiquinone/menaquinone biosynthesis C-methylase UbiE
MPAHYDNYDYSAYWNGREYEHESEVIALREFLKKIRKVNRALEIGGGFGRLVPFYVYRTKSTIFTEPSAKLLSLAKHKLKNFKNIKFRQSTLENLTKKLRKESFDMILMIRVMHHLENPENAFSQIEKLAAPGGYFVLEFANKIHFKNVFEHFVKKDFGFINNLETIDVRSAKSKRQKTIAFLNYHPSLIKEMLEKHNFEVIETRSVSNIRSTYLKQRLPKNALLEIEKALQKPLSFINFGPSIFVLARKKG